MIRPFTGIPNKYVKTQNDRPQLVAATDVVAASNFVPRKLTYLLKIMVVGRLFSL